MQQVLNKCAFLPALPIQAPEHPQVMDLPWEWEGEGAVSPKQALLLTIPQRARGRTTRRDSLEG